MNKSPAYVLTLYLPLCTALCCSKLRLSSSRNGVIGDVERALARAIVASPVPRHNMFQLGCKISGF